MRIDFQSSGSVLAVILTLGLAGKKEIVKEENNGYVVFQCTNIHESTAWW
jgi:hypothetical protein